MSLPTKSDLVSYLRLTASVATAEDTLLAALLARAQSAVESFVQRPINAVVTDYVDDAETLEAYGHITRLMLPVWPVDPDTLVITDADDATVDATTYRVAAATGVITAKKGVTFPNGPYTLSAACGLSAAPDFGSRVEPVLAQAMLDLASDLYHKRDPNLRTDNSGGGVSQTRDLPEIPPRVQALLRTIAPLTGIS